MLKRKYDPIGVILTLFVTLVPILGALWDKTAVTYASLCVCLVVFGHTVYKNGAIILTKTSAVMLIIALYSFAGLGWASDKGAHFAYSVVFLSAALAGVGAREAKRRMGDSFDEGALRVGYIAALVYGAVAVFCQIFIESKFLLGGMDLINGSSAMTAIIMLWGIYSCVKLFEGKAKSLGYYPSLVFMTAVFVLAGSAPGYFCATLVLLYIALKVKRKRVESFVMWVGVILTGLYTLVYAVISLLTSRVSFEGAFRGLVSVVGLGKGGYNALGAVLDGGYKSAPPVFIELTEAFGIVGIIIVILTILCVWIVCTNTNSVRDVLGALSFAVFMLTSSNALLCIVLFAALAATFEDGIEVKISRGWSLLIVLPLALGAFLTFSRIPYALGQNAFELGEYKKAEEYFAFGARCEMFSSQGWEKAYLSGERAYEKGEDNALRQKEYALNAQRFNKKNYKYRKYIADAEIRIGNEEEALEIWEGIISRYDKEALYAEYAEKIGLVMEKGNKNLLETEALYKTLEEYANKAESLSVKKEINDILAKSQKYYIEKREGITPVPAETITDYYESETDFAQPTEVDTEDI